MRSVSALAIAMLGLAAALACGAQDAPPVRAQAAPRLSTGTVTGTVYCADTDLPARLVVVNLIQTAGYGYAVADTATTDLDGRFAFNHVQEGDYYGVAVLPGYENLMSVMTKTHLDQMTADDRKKLLALATSVTVTANLPGQLSIRLERGAEINGTATYDDGSPAIGLHVSIALKTGDEGNGGAPQSSSEPPIYSGAGPTTTDDRGRFRILGVLPGVYVVSVSVPARWAASTDKNPFAELMESSVGAMDVYMGGGQRATKAETIKVTTGGASKDADITIPLSRLHTIRGQVLMKSTNQPPGSATVRLLYADTREEARTMVAPNGEFEFHYVPEDSFILRAVATPWLAPYDRGTDSIAGHPWPRYLFTLQSNYEGNESSREMPTEMPLVVTSDMDGVSISVPDPLPSGQGAPNNGAGQSTPSNGAGQSGNSPQ
ncbi:MAG: carboxypeptidase-like regulatory domain-containing protein [Terracidiphilus sp.]